MFHYIRVHSELVEGIDADIAGFGYHLSQACLGNGTIQDPKLASVANGRPPLFKWEFHLVLETHLNIETVQMDKFCDQGQS